jgi:hypothetical protein
MFAAHVVVQFENWPAKIAPANGRHAQLSPSLITRKTSARISGRYMFPSGSTMTTSVISAFKNLEACSIAETTSARSAVRGPDPVIPEILYVNSPLNGSSRLMADEGIGRASHRITAGYY